MAEANNLPLNEIKKRVLSSFLTLTARTFLLRIFSFITLNIILARVLPVETLGIFNIATGLVTLFAYFSDVGLGASLIQKKDQIKQSDIVTTFTIQFLIVGFLSLFIVLGAPWLGAIYHLNADGVWLIRILGLTFFLTSLKVVPSVLLERELKFKPIITTELIETLIFNFTLIILTFNFFGIWAFTLAALFRAVSGVLFIYFIAPVKIGFGIERTSAKSLLSFGIPFQLNSLLALLKDRLVPLVVANMVGALGVGYITWAQNMAFLPMEFMNLVIRIAFPTFSRLQEDKQMLSKAVEKSLFVISSLVYPALFGIGAILPVLITYVVSSKWQPAISSFYLFAFASYWAVISTTLTNTLNAVGQVKTTLKLMIMWTVLEWSLTPLAVLIWGFKGVGISAFLISFSSLITIILVNKKLSVRVFESVFLPTVCAFLMSVVVYVFAVYFIRDRLMVIPAILLGGLVYGSLMLIFAREKIIQDFKSLKNG